MDPVLDEIRERAVELARMAREEDLGAGDLTGALVEGDEIGVFRLVARQRGILAGRAIAAEVLGVYGDSIELTWSERATDGARIGEEGDVLATLRGPCKVVLAAERVFLNFLQRLSGIATLTRAYVDALAGTGVQIFDTRKTTPGWRLLEKYAVRYGGGCNHRMGLHDAILIKDNHLAGVPTEQLAGRVFEMLSKAQRHEGAKTRRGWRATMPRVEDSRGGAPEMERRPAFVEVEADSVEQAAELFKVTGIDVILLDNFSHADLRKVIEMRDGLGLKATVALEASGGITLETVRAVAQTGVDRISVGAITHSAPALDLALERHDNPGGTGDEDGGSAGD
ncbi:MAG: nicotinate-nucleotide diphosphorylase [Phycisphaerae bacterium]